MESPGRGALRITGKIMLDDFRFYCAVTASAYGIYSAGLCAGLWMIRLWGDYWNAPKPLICECGYSKEMCSCRD